MNARRVALPATLAMTLLPALAAADGWRTLSLADHNTRLVVVGTLLLGIASGLVGCFVVLRKRALVGDAIAHATLPGVAVAALLLGLFGAGRSLPALLAGAAVAALLGLVALLALRRFTRLGEDVNLGVVLGVFFGAGVMLKGVVAHVDGTQAAGLSQLIYGMTAAMTTPDVALIAASTLLAIATVVAMFRPFQVLCFDADFASAQGWPVALIDAALMALLLVVTVVGLQAVGAILMVALLVIPPVAARFWTNDLRVMASLSAMIGGLACVAGALASGLAPRLPSGALIVLAASALFGVSLVFGPVGGLWHEASRRARMRARMDRLHLLRALFELRESKAGATPVAVDELRQRHQWSPRRLMRALAAARREGLVASIGGGALALSPSGAEEAARLVRGHRLWEWYLIEEAAVPPERVDTEADRIEHVLDADWMQRLEEESRARHSASGEHPLPPNPHADVPLVKRP